MGSGESWFEPRRGNSEPDVAARGVGLGVSRREPPELPRRFAVGGTPQFEPRPPAWAIELHHSTHRLLIGVLVSEQGARIPPTAGRRDVLEREVLSFRCPSASEHVPKSSPGFDDPPALKHLIEPVGSEVSGHRATPVTTKLRTRMREQQH